MKKSGRVFTNNDIVCFLSFLRVWIDHKGWSADSLLEAWNEFKGSHTADQDPDIQETTKLLAQQLIERSKT